MVAVVLSESGVPNQLVVHHAPRVLLRASWGKTVITFWMLPPLKASFTWLASDGGRPPRCRTAWRRRLAGCAKCLPMHRLLLRQAVLFRTLTLCSVINPLSQSLIQFDANVL